MCAFAIPTATAQAQEPWPCDGAGYTSQFDAQNPGPGTLFFRVEQQPDGSLQRIQIGSLPAQHFNAIGFRPQDGFMYALNQTTEEIMRISSDPSGAPEFESLGLPAGSGLVFPSVSGTILDDGTYFIWSANSTSGAIFDVSGPTAQLVRTITLDPGSPFGPAGDMAVSPVDGELYSINTDPNGTTFGVYRFDLDVAGGTITRGPRVADTTSAGAQWFLPDGRLAQYNNGVPGPNGNGLYASNLETGELTFHGSGPQFSNADGTGCPYGLAVTKDADPRTVVAGAQVTYTHTITSRALGDSPVEFSDVLPAGMTYVPGGVTVSSPSFTTNDFGGTDTLGVSGTMSRGDAVTITATAAVPSDTACGSDVPNQSQATLAVPGLPEVAFDSDDPTTPDILTDPTSIGVVCAADLAIAKSAPATVAPGGQIAWTLRVTNNGPSDSPGATVQDSIPAGVTNVATSTPGCSVAGGMVACAVGALAAGASTEIVVTGTAPATPSISFTNTATVTGPLDDPDPNNNTGTSTSRTTPPPPPPPAPADVTVDKSASDGRVSVGDRVNYRLVVRNNGPGVATDTVVNDTVPSRLDVRSASASQGDCSVSGNRVSCAVGTLAAGQEVTVSVRARALRAGRATNNASVDSPQCTTHPCGEDAARVRVVKPELRVSKTAGKRSVRAGQTISYKIRVRNPSGRAVRNVRTCDDLPAGLVFVSAKPKAKLSEGQRCWTAKRLGARKSKTYSVTVRVLPGTSGRKVNRATATSPNARSAARAKRAVKVQAGERRPTAVTG